MPRQEPPEQQRLRRDERCARQRPWGRSWLIGVLLSLSLLGACDVARQPVDPAAPLLLEDGRLDVDVVVRAEAGAGLRLAAGDLCQALARVSGGVQRAPILGALPDTSAGIAIVLELEPSASLDSQSYRIVRADFSGGRRGLRIVAASEIGLIYGTYELIADLGVRYYHPERTFYPAASPTARLPWHYLGKTRSPSFALRGFHEHTQHPIVMSDALLRPGRDDFRQIVSNYLKWLVRNRQNVLTFHLLKTVDLDGWLPYIAGIVAEAKSYGISVGPFTSFSDQQQNSLAIVSDPALAKEQITAFLDKLLTAGFGLVGFQIGSSEFTKTSDETVSLYLSLATSYLAAHHPGVRAFAWIHTTCSLKQDDGGYFYHLPLKVDPRLGAFVHTTMFYTLRDPAPVYDCEDFTHQLEFLRQANGTRELVFFPESAWWLGFDNNVPLALPITGLSRERDIRENLAPFDVAGHVTFTSGREWTYWQIDHFLTRISWDRRLSWRGYLQWIKPLYGALADAVVGALWRVTALQETYLYHVNPLLTFYLAGELPQDEVGETAGVLARRPKPALTKILALDDAAFEEWRTRDFTALRQMEAELAPIVQGLPSALASGSEQQQRLYRELYHALHVYQQRLLHTIAIYAGVVAARAWLAEQRRAAGAVPPRNPDPAVASVARLEAQARLEEARTISRHVIDVVRSQEADYRYPLELLSQPKPASLTAYPFGYLYETSTGYFWTRRDEQLAALIAALFDAPPESWRQLPTRVIVARPEQLTIETPKNPLASSAIASFIPQMLVGLSEVQPVALTLSLAQDRNQNLLPDPGTEQRFELTRSATGYLGVGAAYGIDAYDNTGSKLGTLTLLQPELELVPGSGSFCVERLDLRGAVSSNALIALIRSIAGIDRQGLRTLLKAVFAVPAGEPLPDELPVHLVFRFEDCRTRQP